jgi:hypothetical protein
MRERIVDILVTILLVEGVIALSLLIAFTVYRMSTGN